MDCGRSASRFASSSVVRSERLCVVDEDEDEDENTFIVLTPNSSKLGFAAAMSQNSFEAMRCRAFQCESLGVNLQGATE
jgi:hypothetical protein